MKVSIRITAVLLGLSAPAAAEHQHTVAQSDGGAFGAGVAVVAASFDTIQYVGNYQGIVPTVQWSNARYAVGTSAALYRLEKNGAHSYGLGDLLVTGQAVLVASSTARAGVVAGLSVPIGNDTKGFGMGHMMAMPAVFGSWTIGRVTALGTAGYSRAISGDMGHDHGSWPLVEPMNLSELTWSASGEVAIVPDVRAGARMSGGIPIGSDGDNRVVASVRAAWRTGRVDSGAEVQVGVAGDPFTIRGVVSTALSF